MCTRTQEKGAVTPKETDPDLPVSSQESPAEVWVGSSLLQGRGLSVQQHMHGTFEGGRHYFITSTIVWPQVKQQGRNTALPINRKLDSRFTQLWCWRRLLRAPWTVRRSNQSILKEISPEYSLERLMLKAEVPIFWTLDAKN